MTPFNVWLKAKNIDVATFSVEKRLELKKQFLNEFKAEREKYNSNNIVRK